MFGGWGLGSRGVVLHDILTASDSRNTRVTNSLLAVFVLVQLNTCLTASHLVGKFNSTLQPTYLNVIDHGLPPVATLGVDRAVSIPEVALIAYIDTVSLPLFVT